MQTHYNETPSLFKTHPLLCILHCTLTPFAVALIFLLTKAASQKLAENAADTSLFVRTGTVLILLIIVCAAIQIFTLWLKTKTTRLIVTDVSTTYRTGILSKTIVEVMHKDVRAIIVKQGLMQRLLRTGDVQIASAGISDFEITAKGFSNPASIKEIIGSYRQQDATPSRVSG